MSFLNNVFSSLISTEMTSVVSKVIAEHGGVAGIVAKFEQGGLGHLVQSWVGTGSNLPLTAQQLQQILGDQSIMQIAQHFGLNTQELSQKLAQLLPQVVDHLTPGGAIPQS